MVTQRQRAGPLCGEAPHVRRRSLPLNAAPNHHNENPCCNSVSVQLLGTVVYSPGVQLRGNAGKRRPPADNSVSIRPAIATGAVEYIRHTNGHPNAAPHQHTVKHSARSGQQQHSPWC